MKVNDYVRTDKGTIFKVENITEKDIIDKLNEIIDYLKRKGE